MHIEDEIEDPTEDNTEALAEISSDLFGQSDAGEKVADLGGETPEVPAEVPDPLAVEPPASQTSEDVQAVGAPTSWSKDALADWATIPERAKQEILKREEDMFRGIEQYKERAELGTKYDTVVEPYRAALAAENVDPVSLFQAFAGNHYLMSRGTEEQKYSVAAHVLGGYGIDLHRLASMVAQAPQVDPAVAELRRELNEVRTGLTQRQQAEQAQLRSQIETQVTAFLTDPANVYATEVGDDIAKLLAAGVASTLEEAYEKAVYANPVTRQKEVDRLAAEKTQSLTAAEQARKEAARKATSADVKTSSKLGNGTVPKGTIDDTLEETYAAIQARG